MRSGKFNDAAGEGVSPGLSIGERWLRAAGPAPELRIPDTVEEWEAQRAGIRSELWQLLGELPPRPGQPEVRTLVREERDEYLFEKFEFDNGAGDMVPGYLLLPRAQETASPAILYCHWHGDEYEIGKEEIFRDDHVPEKPGPALVKRGYAVMAIDACCFGEREGQGPGGPAEKGASGEMSAAKFNLWVGRTLWGMILRDDLMALDYLASRPEIDPERIGVTGISMGATRSWWLMALDERLKTGAAVACCTRYQNLIRAGKLAEHGIYYYVPGILRRFDTEAIVAAIAPRPILFMTGDKDPGSPLEGIMEIETKAQEIYRLYGMSANFSNLIYPGVGHEYTPEMWQGMLAWMDRTLGGGRM